MIMDSALEQAQATLAEYFSAVERQKEPNPPDLLPIFEKLDQLQKNLDASAPAPLRHYLYTKSYRKAWNFLQGNDAENTRGSCHR